jgi:hypothetical protein
MLYLDKREGLVEKSSGIPMHSVSYYTNLLQRSFCKEFRGNPISHDVSFVCVFSWTQVQRTDIVSIWNLSLAHWLEALLI